jgi:hypothetical protein
VRKRDERRGGEWRGAKGGEACGGGRAMSQSREGTREEVEGKGKVRRRAKEEKVEPRELNLDLRRWQIPGWRKEVYSVPVHPAGSQQNLNEVSKCVKAALRPKSASHRGMAEIAMHLAGTNR